MKIQTSDLIFEFKYNHNQIQSYNFKKNIKIQRFYGINQGFNNSHQPVGLEQKYRP
jgi:hypothetical protein